MDERETVFVLLGVALLALAGSTMAWVWGLHQDCADRCVPAVSDYTKGRCLCRIDAPERWRVLPPETPND